MARLWLALAVPASAWAPAPTAGTPHAVLLDWGTEAPAPLQVGDAVEGRVGGEWYDGVVSAGQDAAGAYSVELRTLDAAGRLHSATTQLQRIRLRRKVHAPSVLVNASELDAAARQRLAQQVYPPDAVLGMAPRELRVLAEARGLDPAAPDAELRAAVLKSQDRARSSLAELTDRSSMRAKMRALGLAYGQAYFETLAWARGRRASLVELGGSRYRDLLPNSKGALTVPDVVGAGRDPKQIEPLKEGACPGCPIDRRGEMANVLHLIKGAAANLEKFSRYAWQEMEVGLFKQKNSAKLYNVEIENELKVARGQMYKAEATRAKFYKENKEFLNKLEARIEEPGPDSMQGPSPDDYNVKKDSSRAWKKGGFQLKDWESSAAHSTHVAYEEEEAAEEVSEKASTCMHDLNQLISDDMLKYNARFQDKTVDLDEDKLRAKEDMVEGAQDVADLVKTGGAENEEKLDALMKIGQKAETASEILVSHVQSRASKMENEVHAHQQDTNDMLAEHSDDVDKDHSRAVAEFDKAYAKFLKDYERKAKEYMQFLEGVLASAEGRLDGSAQEVLAAHAKMMAGSSKLARHLMKTTEKEMEATKAASVLTSEYALEYLRSFKDFEGQARQEHQAIKDKVQAGEMKLADLQDSPDVKFDKFAYAAPVSEADRTYRSIASYFKKDLEMQTQREKEAFQNENLEMTSASNKLAKQGEKVEQITKDNKEIESGTDRIEARTKSELKSAWDKDHNADDHIDKSLDESLDEAEELRRAGADGVKDFVNQFRQLLLPNGPIDKAKKEHLDAVQKAVNNMQVSLAPVLLALTTQRDDWDTKASKIEDMAKELGTDTDGLFESSEEWLKFEARDAHVTGQDAKRKTDQLKHASQTMVRSSEKLGEHYLKALAQAAEEMGTRLSAQFGAEGESTQSALAKLRARAGDLLKELAGQQQQMQTSAEIAWPRVKQEFHGEQTKLDHALEMLAAVDPGSQEHRTLAASVQQQYSKLLSAQTGEATHELGAKNEEDLKTLAKSAADVQTAIQLQYEELSRDMKLGSKGILEKLRAAGMTDEQAMTELKANRDAQEKRLNWMLGLYSGLCADAVQWIGKDEAAQQDVEHFFKEQWRILFDRLPVLANEMVLTAQAQVHQYLAHAKSTLDKLGIDARGMNDAQKVALANVMHATQEKLGDVDLSTQGGRKAVAMGAHEQALFAKDMLSEWAGVDLDEKQGLAEQDLAMADAMEKRLFDFGHQRKAIHDRLDGEMGALVDGKFESWGRQQQVYAKAQTDKLQERFATKEQGAAGDVEMTRQTLEGIATDFQTEVNGIAEQWRQLQKQFGLDNQKSNAEGASLLQSTMRLTVETADHFSEVRKDRNEQLTSLGKSMVKLFSGAVNCMRRLKSMSGQFGAYAAETAKRKEAAAELMESDTVKSLQKLAHSDAVVKQTIQEMRFLEEWATKHGAHNLEWKKEVLEGFRELGREVDWGKNHLFNVMHQVEDMTTKELKQEVESDQEEVGEASRRSAAEEAAAERRLEDEVAHLRTHDAERDAKSTERLNNLGAEVEREYDAEARTASTDLAAAKDKIDGRIADALQGLGKANDAEHDIQSMQAAEVDQALVKTQQRLANLGQSSLAELRQDISDQRRKGVSEGELHAELEARHHRLLEQLHRLVA